jgi:hypothetical protein
MKIQKKLLTFFSLYFLFSACSSTQINYKEKLEGIWQISNFSEIMKHGDDSKYDSEEIRNATLAFESNGKLIANIGKKRQDGKWTVSKDGRVLQLKADSLKFDEKLKLIFENERTITIYNNGKKFELKKIN